jgi:integrator complex subunit 1
LSIYNCVTQVYIDDALGERVWVDRADCKGFVDNIVTAFNTNAPTGGISSLEVKTEPGSGKILRT